MKKQPKKLVLNKETLRDLTAHNAGEVKGAKGPTFTCYFCQTVGFPCQTLRCTHKC